MARTRFKDILRFTEGYYYSRPELAEGDYLADGTNAIQYGGVGMWRPFRGVAIEAGKIGSPLMFNINGGYAGLGNKASVSTAKGSVASYMKDALLIVGSGEVYVNGARLQAGTGPTNVSASTTPRMVLKQSGSYTGSADNGPFEMGLDVPRIPTVATVASGNTSRMGVQSSPSTYSIQVCAGRSLTGHISNPAAVSTPLSVSNLQAMAVTFGAADSNGADRWHLFCSKEDEGGTGAHLKFPREIKEAELSASETKTASHTNGSPVVTLTVGTVDRDDIGKRIRIANFDGIGGTFTSWIRDVPVAPGATTATTLTMADNITATGSGKTATIDAQVGGVARTLAFEWYDSDLLDELPPTDHLKPAKSVFLAVLGERILNIGCFADGTSDPTAANPGTMAQVSKIGYPEAFPADFNHLYALPGQPTAVLTREADGVVIVFGANYCATFDYDGVDSDGNRVIRMTVLWSNLGINSQNQACFADGQLYLYTGAHGMVRMDDTGRADLRFAAPVSDYMASRSASAVIVGYDPTMMQVFYCPTGTTPGALPFSRAGEVWGPPLSPAGVALWPSNGGAFRAGIVAFFTNANSGYAVMDTGGADYAVYLFNDPAGAGSTWSLISGWREGGHPGVVKTITAVEPVLNDLNFHENTDLTVIVARNLESGSAGSKSFTGGTQGTPHYLWKSNVKNCRSYRVTVNSAASGFGGFNYCLIEGTANPIHA
jgi:hypothetical protein